MEDIIKEQEEPPWKGSVHCPPTLFQKIVNFFLLFSRHPCSPRVPMSVITIVHRAFAAGLPWKRRVSTDKGKGKETDIDVSSSGRDPHEHIHFGTHNADIPGLTLHSLHRDVSLALHVAVKPSLDHTTRPEDSPDYPDESGSFESDSDAESQVEHETRFPSHSSASSARANLARVVSWASIVRSRCRWTKEQESELLMAGKQLARCQKAWSSEQELWLAYVRVFTPFF